MISLIIPMYNGKDMTFDLLKDLQSNIISPTEILLIDDCSDEKIESLCYDFPKLPIRYIRNKINLGVNASWNLGLKEARNKVVSILNNDIRVNRYFIKMILETMSNQKVGICVPNTVNRMKDIYRTKNENVIIEELHRREGWAFSIRQDVVIKENIFIPSEDAKTWCGDRYWFEYFKALGYRNVKMKNNYIYHLGSQTIFKLHTETELKEEQKRFVDKHLRRN